MITKVKNAALPRTAAAPTLEDHGSAAVKQAAMVGGGAALAGAALGAYVGKAYCKNRPYAGAAVGAALGQIASLAVPPPAGVPDYRPQVPAAALAGTALLAGAGAGIAYLFGKKPMDGAVVAVGSAAALMFAGDVGMYVAPEATSKLMNPV